MRFLGCDYNLLASRHGRLTAFFFLYLTEGIPNGFAMTAMVTQMRRQGIEPGQIALFTAAFSIPWAFKWLMGPVVDLFYSDRLGRRRLWIMAMQIMMCATLLAALPFATNGVNVAVLSVLIIVHNVFAATQDVAIDALACGTLPEHERGTANGLMFAGAFCGSAVGGAGVLGLLSAGVPFGLTFPVVCGVILCVTCFITLHVREARIGDALPVVGSRFTALALALREYWRNAFAGFFGTRSAVVGIFVAILPMGAYAFSMSVSNSLSVEMGFSNGFMAKMGILGTLIAASGSIAGGFLSDRFGRRRMLAFYAVGTAVPTLILAWAMYHEGWIMPLDLKQVAPIEPSRFLFWVNVATGLVYGLFTGMLQGTRPALFMDVCSPKVAATQFTAYMALLNVVIGYSNFWQGQLVMKLGYPMIFTIDALLGLLFILLLPLMDKHPGFASKEEQSHG